MKKKMNKLIIITLCLILTIGIYLTADYIISNKKQSKTEDDIQIFQTTLVSDITEISYTYNNNTMTFDLVNGVWVNKDYTNYPINQNTVKSIADTALNLLPLGVLEQTGDLTEYGFNSPQMTITITMKDGTENLLTIGDNTAGNYYLTTSNIEDKIFIVSSELHDKLSFNIYDFVAYDNIPNFESTDVYKVSMKYNSNTYEFTKSSAGDEEEVSAEPYWEGTKNDSAFENNAVDCDLALSYLNRLTLNSCISYDAPESSLSACGLLNPYANITVYYLDSNLNENSFTLKIGMNASGNYYYTELNNNKQITTCVVENLDNILSLLSGE